MRFIWGFFCLILLGCGPTTHQGRSTGSAGAKPCGLGDECGEDSDRELQLMPASSFNSSVATLRIVGARYSGVPVSTSPRAIQSCNGGGGPECQAVFRAGSRVTITFPRVVNGSLMFDYYYCVGARYSTVTGRRGENVATIFMQESMDCTAYYRSGSNPGSGPGAALLSIVGSAYSGQAVTTNPPNITRCRGGNGSECRANFDRGSRVQINFPSYIQASGQYLNFSHYFCQNRQTTITGKTGQTQAVIFLSNDLACTAYYFPYR